MKNKTLLTGAIAIIISIIIIQITVDTSVTVNTILAIAGTVSAFIVLRAGIAMLLGDDMQHIKKGDDPMEALLHESIELKYAVSKLLTRSMICIALIATGYLLLIHRNVDLFAEGASLEWMMVLPVIFMLVGVVELYYTFNLFVNDKRVFLRLMSSGLQRSQMPFIPMRHHAANAFIKWENILDVKIKRSLPFGTQNIIITASAQAGGKTHTRKHRIKVLCSEQSAEEILRTMEMYYSSNLKSTRP